MPTYDHRCDNGHEFELYLRLEELQHDQVCECGRPAIRLIRAPMIFVAPDICYDSPTTGKSITSKQARIEDLKRSGCVEYDPGMRQDYDRRAQEGERKLEQVIEASVEQQIQEMPARKRELLQTELASGATAEPVRQTLGG
jgi:hypothetical protein